MKKITALILVISLCACLCSCGGSLIDTVKGYLGKDTVERPADYIETKQNELYEYDVHKKYIVLVEYLGSEPDVVVPTEIDGKPVTVIGSSCFYRNTALQTVIVPEGIQKIENAAFYCCSSLRRAKLPESCTSYGEKLFSWCTSLEEIILPTGMTEIPDYAFNYCSSLTDIVWNSTVTHIGVRAFSFCEGLTSVEIPESVLTIDEFAFYECGTLQSVTLPPHTVYAPTAFNECEQATVSGGVVQTEVSDISEIPQESQASESIGEEISQTVSE